MEEFESDLYGFLVVYVDDIMILSQRGTVTSVRDALQKEWDTSPEWIGPEPVKFLGMEVSEHDRGYLTNQISYIQDKTAGLVLKKSKVPTPGGFASLLGHQLCTDWRRFSGPWSGLHYLERSIAVVALWKAAIPNSVDSRGHLL